MRDLVGSGAKFYAYDIFHRKLQYIIYIKMLIA